MPAKKKTKSSSRPTYDIKGGIHATEFVGGDKTVYNAGRDMIMGDQINTTYQSPAELVTALQKLMAQMAELKNQPGLTDAQKTIVTTAEQKTTEAIEEANKPQPVGERIKATLTEAKEYMDLLAGSLASAAALGTTIGTILLGAAKLFGF